MNTVHSYVRVSSAVVLLVAAVVVAVRVGPDWFRPSRGDVEVVFDSCGRASVQFDGEPWNEESSERRELAGLRVPGHFRVLDTPEHDRGAVVVEVPSGEPLRIHGLVRKGFVTAVGCI